MRTIYFYVLMTLLTFGVFAQTNKKYVISQKVEKEYDELNLKPYTSLRLVKSDKDVLEISLRDTSVDISGICTLKNGVLTLDYKSENPDETNLTLYSSMEFKHIHVSSFAKLYADTIQMRKKRSWIQIDDYGLIEADSVIAGRVSTIYGGDHAVNNIKDINDIKKVVRIMEVETDTLNISSSWGKRRNGFTLLFNMGWASILKDNAVYNSPYNSESNYNLTIGIAYNYYFNKNCKLKVGSGYRYSYKKFVSDVEYLNGDLVLIDEYRNGMKNDLFNHSVVLPIEFHYRFTDRISGFYLGLVPEYNVWSTLRSRYITESNDWSSLKTRIKNINPWKMELILGLKCLVKVELYYNLLPTYKIGTKGDGLREFGIRIGF